MHATNNTNVEPCACDAIARHTFSDDFLSLSHKERPMGVQDLEVFRSVNIAPISNVLILKLRLQRASLL